MSCYSTNRASVHTLVIAPNASFTLAQAEWFFLGMCVLTCSIGIILTVWGLWLIWPFDALAMAALAAVLFPCVRHNNYREVVTVSADTIRVDAGHGHSERHWEFPRPLTQIQLHAAEGNAASRLLVMRSGRGCELGRCLTDEERTEVAARIKKWIYASEFKQSKHINPNMTRF